MIETVYIRHKKAIVENGRIKWVPTNHFYIMRRSLDPAGRGHDYWPIEEYSLPDGTARLYDQESLKKIIQDCELLPDDANDVLTL